MSFLRKTAGASVICPGEAYLPIIYQSKFDTRDLETSPDPDNALIEIANRFGSKQISVERLPELTFDEAKNADDLVHELDKKVVAKSRSL